MICCADDLLISASTQLNNNQPMHNLNGKFVIKDLEKSKKVTCMELDCSIFGQVQLFLYT